MGLFSKRKAAPTHPVFDFWAWWAAEGERLVTEAIAANQIATVVKIIAKRVAAIDPELDWELGPGAVAEHRFSLTSGGVAHKRPLAERWKRAAPAETKTWEFATSREAKESPLSGGFEYNGHRLQLDSLRFSPEFDESKRRVHVESYHPDFEALSKNDRLAVTFLALDWLLGEDDVERWLGGIDASATATDSSLTGEQFAAAVVEFAGAHSTEAWAVFEGTARGGAPLLTFARQGTRWIDRPLLDLHNEITVRFARTGFPDSEALERLREMEDEIEKSFSLSAVFIAHETTGGERTFHLYSDSEDVNVTEAIARFALANAARHSSRIDPSWQRVRAYTG